MKRADKIPVIIFGGSGYVAGELLRLLLGHPRFKLAAIASTSQVGERITQVFTHLRGTAADELVFESPESVERLFTAEAEVGLLAATPHGATAALIDRALTAAMRAGARLRVVDLSADFRFRDAETYARIYKQEHPAKERLAEFTSCIPELYAGAPPMHATQPGCFTTAVTLAAYPFCAADLIEDEIFAAAITGSSGSGRKLSEGTHHPSRRSSLYAYNALAHRHEVEMSMLLGAARGGRNPEVEFVPHSGPFVRGIHATLRMRLTREMSAEELVAIVSERYAASPFVSASTKPPRLNEVVGTNRCALGVMTRGRTLVVTSVIDNLIKGAAGGGLQWLNRLFSLPDETGLVLAGLGWY